jgi:hypothetical protein
MSSITITFLIVAGIVVLFVWNRIPVVLVAIGTALALYFTGVLDLDQSLRGFGDPAVIFIASLFAVSAGFDATAAGARRHAGERPCGGAGGRGRRLSAVRTARKPRVVGSRESSRYSSTRLRLALAQL